MFAGLGVLAAILFAVGNRAPATLSLWPLPVAIAAPLFLLVLLAAISGAVLGGVGSWLAAAPRRRRLRLLQRRVGALEAELAEAEARADAESASRPHQANDLRSTVKRLVRVP